MAADRRAAVDRDPSRGAVSHAVCHARIGDLPRRADLRRQGGEVASDPPWLSPAITSTGVVNGAGTAAGGSSPT
jgi:hypothetical protein